MYKNKTETSENSQPMANQPKANKQTEMPKSSSKVLEKERTGFIPIHQNWLAQFEV